MLNKTNIDDLSQHSRAYYERALMKMSMSLFFGSLACMFLGFAATSGGLSHAKYKLEDLNPSNPHFDIITPLQVADQFPYLL